MCAAPISGKVLLSRVDYCQSMQICHCDWKLDNTLFYGSPAPLLKICDIGYSKSSLLHSKPKSTVGTPAYIALEVLSRREYDGKISLMRVQAWGLVVSEVWQEIANTVSCQNMTLRLFKRRLDSNTF